MTGRALISRPKTVVQNSITALDREAFEFLFAGQGGLVEMSRDRQRQDLEYLPPEQAVGRLEEFNYFGVVPRARRRGRKQDVGDDVWSLWLDIDDAGGGDELRALGERGLLPTIILHSGRGWWGHWKLSEPVSRGKAEELNRRLIALVGRDAGADKCWGVQQIARLPGSRNERTGVIARVVELSRSDHQPSALDAMLPVEDGTKSSARVVKPLPELPALPDSHVAVRLADLPLFLAQYCMRRPSWETGQKQGLDRSEIEWAIAKELLRRGLSEAQALRWFIDHQLPRHEQEAQRRRSFRWTEALIKSARCSLEEEMPIGPAARPPSPLVEQTLHQPRRGYSKVDREAMLRLVAVISPVSQSALWRALADSFGCSQRAAKANISLGIEFGYLQKANRKYCLTEKAHRQLDRKGRPLAPEGMEWTAFIGDQPRKFLRERREADEWLRNLTAPAAEN